MGNWKDILRALASPDIKDEVVILVVIAGVSAQVDTIRQKDPDIIVPLAKAIILLCKNPSCFVRTAAIACIETYFQEEFKLLQHEVEEKKESNS